MNVEGRYRERVAAMTPTERVARSEVLFRWSREFLMGAILREKGPMSDERLRLELALRVYGSDPRMRTMIEGLLERVAD